MKQTAKKGSRQHAGPPRRAIANASGKSPDQVCSEASERDVALNVSKLDRDTVLIEGSRESLQFLSCLILAQANFEEDCGFHIGPRGPGNVFFSNAARLGIYLHRTPCLEEGPPSSAPQHAKKRTRG